MSYSMYKELQSPTGAEYTVWARLLPARNHSPLLVVARGSVLDIHALKNASDDANSSTAQLHLLGTHQLAGDILALDVLPLSGRGAAIAAGLNSIDVLVLTFADAKVSIVGLEPFTLKLQTVAMLNFEESGVGAGCAVQAKQGARHPAGVAKTKAIRIDPEGRALAMMPYDNQLAVMPVRKAIEGLDEPDDRDLEEDAAVAAAEKDEAAAAAVAQDRLTRRLLHKPYVLDLKDLGSGLSQNGLAGVVSDIGFLHGYSVQPTLAILVQTALTNAIRLASLQHTTSLAAVSLDSTGTATPVVWQRDGLPHDAYAVIPVPSPIGGAVVVSPNALLHADHYKTAGLALNGHAAYTVDVRGRYKLDTNISHDKSAPRICLTLDAVRSAVLTPDRILLTEVNGAMYMLRLHTAGGREVHHMTLLPTGIRGPPATCLSWLPGRPEAVAAVCRAMNAPGPDAADGEEAKDTPAAVSAQGYTAGLLFIASRISDSLLAVACVKTGSTASTSSSGTGMASGSGGAMGEPPGLGDEMLDEDDALYGAGGFDAQGLGQSAPQPAILSLPGLSSSTGAAAASSSNGNNSRKRPRLADAGDEEAPPGSDIPGLDDAEEAPPGAAVDDGGDDELPPGAEFQSAGAGRSAPPAQARVPAPPVPPQIPRNVAPTGRPAAPVPRPAVPSESSSAQAASAPTGQYAGISHRMDNRPAWMKNMEASGAGQSAAPATVPANNNSSTDDLDDDLYGAPGMAGGAGAGASSSGSGQAAGAGRSEGQAHEGEDAYLYGMQQQQEGAAGASAVEDAAPGMDGEAGVDQAVSGDQAEGVETDEDMYGYTPGEGAEGQAGEEGEEGAGSAVLPVVLFLHPVDSLPSLGPVLDGNMARCARLPGEDDEEPPMAPPPTELVLASSRHDSAAITILHKGLRPAVASQLRIPGCSGLFSLPFAPSQQAQDGESSADAEGQSDSAGGLVLMTTDTATRVLAVGEGLAELPQESTELVTTMRTLAATALLQMGAIVEDEDAAPGDAVSDPAAVSAPHHFHVHDGSQSVLVQVHDGGVRVTRAVPGTPVIQELSLALPTDVGGLGAQDGIIITSVSSADPYMLLRLSDCSLRLLTSQEGSDGELIADVVNLPSHTEDIVTASALYKDEDGSLARTLSGDAGAAFTRRVFALLARRSGTIELYVLPSFTRVFAAPAAHIAPHVMVNSIQHNHKASAKTSAAGASGAGASEAAEPCQDEVMDGQGSGGNNGSDGANAGPPPRPRTFIKDLCAIRCGDAIGLVLINSRDDVFAYQLYGAISVTSQEEGRMFMGPLGAHPGGMIPTGQAGLAGPWGSTKDGSSNGRIAIPKLGQGRPVGAKAGQSALDVGRFEDVSKPLQVHRAAVARFIRLVHVPGTVTRLAISDAPPHDLLAAEAALRHFTPSLLRPFRDVSGWHGLAVLTPSPLLAMAFRGTLVPLPLGVPDVLGAAGPSAVPGDHLAWGSMSSGSGAPVTAFTPFSAPFCPGGFIYSHKGYVQFATLPRPQWSTGSESGHGLPRPVPAWLLLNPDGTAPALADSTTVLKLYAPPTEQVDGEAVLPLAPAEGGSWPSIAPEYVYQPEAIPTALVCPGPVCMPFYRHAQGGRTVHRISYLEQASTTMGASALLDWFRRQKAAATAAGKPAPLPPTAAQLACCIQPVFVAGMSTRTMRDYEEELARHRDALDAQGGEYEQVNVGEPIEYGPVPMPYAYQPHPKHKTEDLPQPIAPDPIAAAFNAAGLGRPLSYDAQHSVVLLWGSGADAGTGWGVIDSYGLDPDEHVMTVKEVPLSDSIGAKPEPAIIVGTSYLTPVGEDYRPKGRLLMFRLAQVLVPAGREDDPSATVSVPRLKLMFQEDIKAVPSILVPLAGRNLAGVEYRHVLVGAGKRLQVYEWHTVTGNPRLRMCSFADFRTWVTSIETVRDFVVASDAHGGVYFYCWREEDRQLLPLGQAPDIPSITAASAMVNGDKLGIVSLDKYGNIGVHNYVPNESFVRLRAVGDFRVGLSGTAERLVRTRLAFPMGTSLVDRRKHGVLMPTHSGGLGMLLPLEESTFKRLAMVQRVITYCMPHTGGLNPRLQRNVDTPDAPGRSARAVRNILDGPLLHRILQLSTASAGSLAATVGTTLDRVLANLRDADLAATVF